MYRPNEIYCVVFGGTVRPGRNAQMYKEKKENISSRGGYQTCRISQSCRIIPLGSTPDSVDGRQVGHDKADSNAMSRRMSNTYSSSILKDSSSCSPPCIIGNGKARGMSGGSLKDTVDLTKEHHTEESSSVKSNETTCSKNGENSLSGNLQAATVKSQKVPNVCTLFKTCKYSVGITGVIFNCQMKAHYFIQYEEVP
jgi:hypothetical protein